MHGRGTTSLPIAFQQVLPTEFHHHHPFPSPVHFVGTGTAFCTVFKATTAITTWFERELGLHSDPTPWEEFSFDESAAAVIPCL